MTFKDKIKASRHPKCVCIFELSRTFPPSRGVISRSRRRSNGGCILSYCLCCPLLPKESRSGTRARTDGAYGMTSGVLLIDEWLYCAAFLSCAVYYGTTLFACGLLEALLGIRACCCICRADKDDCSLCCVLLEPMLPRLFLILVDC